MKLNLKTKTKEQEIVKAYLEENASETLAEKINNGTPFQKDGKQLVNRKTLDGFMRYACEEARKLAEKGANSACVEDKVVFGWAIHYFEEESIEDTLLNADGTEYIPAPKPSNKPSASVKAVAKPKPAPQMSLFEFMPENGTETVAVGDGNSDGIAIENEEENDLPTAQEIDEILAEIDLNDNAENQPETVDMETGEILPAPQANSPSSDSPYDADALAILQSIFGDEMILR